MTLPATLRRFRRDARGASAVEFALISIPLLLVVFGIFEYGRLMWTRAAIEETAISAARCMGVGQPSCQSGGSYSATQTTAFVQTQSSNWMVTIPSGGISLNRNASCSGVSGFSQVTIDYTFQTAVPILLGSLASGVPLRSIACFPNQS